MANWIISEIGLTNFNGKELQKFIKIKIMMFFRIKQNQMILFKDYQEIAIFYQVQPLLQSSKIELEKYLIQIKKMNLGFFQLNQFLTEKLKKSFQMITFQFIKILIIQYLVKEMETNYGFQYQRRLGLNCMDLMLILMVS